MRRNQLIVSLRRRFRSGEIPALSADSADGEPGIPLASLGIPENAFVPRAIGRRAITVQTVLSSCCDTQIASEIVQTIAISVIDVHSFREPHQQSVDIVFRLPPSPGSFFLRPDIPGAAASVGDRAVLFYRPNILVIQQ